MLSQTEVHRQRHAYPPGDSVEHQGQPHAVASIDTARTDVRSIARIQVLLVSVCVVYFMLRVYIFLFVSCTVKHNRNKAMQRKTRLIVE